MIDAQNFNRVFDGSALGVAVSDAAGRFVLANDTYSSLTGYSPSELFNLNIATVTHPDDRGGSDPLAQSLLAGETSSFVCEKRYLRKNGDTRWVRVSASRLPDGPDPLAAIAFAEDITSWKDGVAALEAARARSNRLADELLRAESLERRRLAREVHDGVSQLLVAASMNLARLQQQQPEESTDSLLQETEAAVSRATRELRDVSYLLHPPELEEAGLAAAVTSFCRGFAKRSGLAVDLSICPRFDRLDRAAEYALYRVLQEALLNVRRHSGSASATVVLHSDGSDAALEVCDFGRGLAGATPGVGLIAMRERVEALGGAFAIESRPGETIVSARVPSAGMPL